MANLASVILEGANSVAPSVDLGDYDYSETILAESSFLNSAMATLFTDIMEAEQNYMVADVIGAATIIRENSLGNFVDPVVVTENVFKNGIGKIKAAFQKFIAKIREYYKKVIDWFKAMTSNAEDFVKNYGDAIKKKGQKAKEFSYTGFKYTIAAGDSKCKELSDAANSMILSQIEIYDKVSDSKSTADFKAEIASKLKADFKEDDHPTASDMVEKFLSGKKYDDLADVRKSLTETYRDGDDKKKTIKGFEDNSVNEMVTYLKTSKKDIDKFQKDLNTYESNVKKIISKLNKIESKEGTDISSDNQVQNASYLSSVISAFLNVYKVPCEVQIALHKEIVTAWLGVLKKLYNYRGKEVRESADIFDAEAYAMLENSIILEGDDESDDEDEVSEGKDCEDAEECTESAIASILEQASRFTM